MSNQEGVHASVRSVTGTSLDYLSDWHALFTANSVAAGPWNERMLSFLNTNLGTSYTSLTDAMNAFAISQGFPAGWNSMNSFTLSAAAALLAAETQGLAIDFTDDAFLGRDGFYGSAEIKDTGTPANNYSAAPTKTASSLLTYTSPSPKLTFGPGGASGVLRYQAHNLFLNSASPANQSVTVVSGATYSVILTGSVTTTLSGAATGTITAGTTSFTAATTTLTFGSTSGTGTVQVTRTPADLTYLATAGSARYALALQWTSAGVLEGLLCEEARTNLVTTSETLLASVAGLTNSSTSITNPYGGTTARKLASDTASSSVHVNFTSFTATAAAYTWTAILKAAELSWAYLRLDDGSTERGAYFNLSNGTVGTTEAGITAAISDCGNGWYRCSVTRTLTAASWFYTITLASADNTKTFATSIGNGIYGIGAQLELGGFATSPIQTFGSTVTRAADNISFLLSLMPFSAATTTIFAEMRSGPQDNGRVAALYINGGQRYADIYRTGSDIAVFSNNTNMDNAVNGAPSFTAGYKTALAMAANDLRGATNGTLVYNDTSATMSVTPDTLAIGSYPAGTSATQSIIKRLMVVPRRMTNAELQTLTTP